MKFFPLLLSVCLLVSCNNTSFDAQFTSADVDNFWQALDAVKAEKDSVKQLALINELFINKASAGQKAMMEARNYTDIEYRSLMNDLPEFWNDLRNNTRNIDGYSDQINDGLTKFQGLYPELTHSDIYYTIGAFRSPGTGFDSLVLIGTEFGLGHASINTSEFPENMSHVKNYYKINPVEQIDFLCVHEYVHTQQEPIVNNLLCQTLFEGIAEFMAVKATGKKSPWKAFVYGPENHDAVRQRFEQEMFNWRKGGNWLWNSTENVFGTADMGYYVGYCIAESYYEKAADKTKAIKDLIELDFSKDEEVDKLVSESGYFSASLDELYERFESNRPKATGVRQFENGSETVDPATTEITIDFSEELDTRFRSTGLGELGKEHFPKVHSIEFSENGKAVTYTVALEANKRYQILLENSYRTSDDNPLKPYLIDFTTAEK